MLLEANYYKIEERLFFRTERFKRYVVNTFECEKYSFLLNEVLKLYWQTTNYLSFAFWCVKVTTPAELVCHSFEINFSPYLTAIDMKALSLQRTKNLHELKFISSAFFIEICYP